MKSISDCFSWYDYGNQHHIGEHHCISVLFFFINCMNIRKPYCISIYLDKVHMESASISEYIYLKMGWKEQHLEYWKSLHKSENGQWHESCTSISRNNMQTQIFVYYISGSQKDIIAYLKCFRYYPIKCVMIGKILYPSDIIPILGSSVF